MREYAKLFSVLTPAMMNKLLERKDRGDFPSDVTEISEGLQDEFFEFQMVWKDYHDGKIDHEELLKELIEEAVDVANYCAFLILACNEELIGNGMAPYVQRSESNHSDAERYGIGDPDSDDYEPAIVKHDF